MLNLRSRNPIKRPSNLTYYKVTFEQDVRVDDLFVPVTLTDSKNKRVVKGTIHGVECSTVQDDKGISSGDDVVIAIWTGSE